MFPLNYIPYIPIFPLPTMLLSFESNWSLINYIFETVSLNTKITLYISWCNTCNRKSMNSFLLFCCCSLLVSVRYTFLLLLNMYKGVGFLILYGFLHTHLSDSLGNGRNRMQQKVSGLKRGQRNSFPFRNTLDNGVTNKRRNKRRNNKRRCHQKPNRGGREVKWPWEN